MNAQCPKCFRYLKLTKHHVLPRRFFGENSSKLLICRDCHSKLEMMIPVHEQQPPDFYREVITKFLGYSTWKTILGLLLVVILVGSAYGQTKIIAPPFYSHEAHKDLEDMEEDIRFKTVVIVAIEPRAIYWKRESRDLVGVGTFTTDDRTQGTPQKGCFVLIYCYTHNYLYALYPCREVMK